MSKSNYLKENKRVKREIKDFKVIITKYFYIFKNFTLSCYYYNSSYNCSY